jgi:hypothetical protein
LSDHARNQSFPAMVGGTNGHQLDHTLPILLPHPPPQVPVPGWLKEAVRLLILPTATAIVYCTAYAWELGHFSALGVPYPLITVDLFRLIIPALLALVYFPLVLSLSYTVYMCRFKHSTIWHVLLWFGIYSISTSFLPPLWGAGIFVLIVLWFLAAKAKRGSTYWRISAIGWTYLLRYGNQGGSSSLWEP